MGQMYPSTCPNVHEPRVHSSQRSAAHSSQNQLAPPLPTSTRFAPLILSPPRHRHRHDRRRQPRPHPRASAMLVASLRPGPSLAAFPASARRSPVPFLPFPARLHHRSLLLSATAEGTGAPAGQGDASDAPVDEARLPQVRSTFLLACWLLERAARLLLDEMPTSRLD